MANAAIAVSSPSIVLPTTAVASEDAEIRRERKRRKEKEREEREEREEIAKLYRVGEVVQDLKGFQPRFVPDASACF